MNIKKVTSIIVTTTDGIELKDGMTVIFNKIGSNESYAMTYHGLDDRGNIILKSLMGDYEVHMMPKSINKMFRCTVDIIEEDIE